MERLRYEVKEHVLTLLLSAKGKVLGIEEVFVGSASQATVHPREIFETALHHHASALILVHNHPSGDNAQSSRYPSDRAPGSSGGLDGHSAGGPYHYW